MKKTVFLISIVFFSMLTAQNRIEEESGEVFIKQDDKYLKELENINNSSDIFDGTLDLKTYKSRFEFLNRNTDLSIDYNDVTFTYVKKFLSYRWYPKIIGLSVYYFPLFESKLDHYGIPRELKYLAVVESALNPRAGSWVGASGLWQFMPATGAEYGLRKNELVNTFYDPMSNADAGARYLRDLYKKFGDWNLAISAYNCGAGNVNKAIRKAGTKNYWKVRPYLPKETQAYVPSFIAVNYLFNFYKEHGMRPSYFKYDFFDMKVIRMNEDTSFQELSKRFNYSVLKFANPQFITNIIPKGSMVYVNK
ncbi:lytic transglycosylase domain-containing protein [Chryseobacterium fistulae]|uniref:Membrane-bound lytic murein transglycosylase D n=1 Tax=Chryseobacterium fistulae TaxID=2675058 RepID=A0A6N4XTJ9_9FLAO|nr:lytic transglycosylase domain-containing protein [Chryseobacterium fistulae]CAA7393298.1 Membrane-bound lytic murein transglycosylase D [Chryseobacterium fistulae]